LAPSPLLWCDDEGRRPEGAGKRGRRNGAQQFRQQQEGEENKKEVEGCTGK
jgi:hypothetical protein